MVPWAYDCVCHANVEGIPNQPQEYTLSRRSFHTKLNQFSFIPRGNHHFQFFLGTEIHHKEETESSNSRISYCSQGE